MAKERGGEGGRSWNVHSLNLTGWFPVAVLDVVEGCVRSEWLERERERGGGGG